MSRSAVPLPRMDQVTCFSQVPSCSQPIFRCDLLIMFRMRLVFNTCCKRARDVWVLGWLLPVLDAFCFMSDLHLWMQVWSNQGEMILTSAERVEKIDSSAIAVHCPEAEFRLSEASLYQVLHRTTANEPLNTVQQTQGQKGFEAQHAIVEVRSKEHVRQKTQRTQHSSATSQKEAE